MNIKFAFFILSSVCLISCNGGASSGDNTSPNSDHPIMPPGYQYGQIYFPESTITIGLNQSVQINVSYINKTDPHDPIYDLAEAYFSLPSYGSSANIATVTPEKCTISVQKPCPITITGQTKGMVLLHGFVGPTPAGLFINVQ